MATKIRLSLATKFNLLTIALVPAISGDLLSAVISTHYIFGFRKDNPNVFNNLIQNWPHF
jgi:hypothetical protein